MAAVERARPPDDRLVPGAGERDVGQAQVLAALLGVVLLQVPAPVRARRAPTSIVRASPASGSWKKTGSGSRASGTSSQRYGQVDDRELEALAAVDREDLDGLGVGLQAAAALLVGGVAVGLGDAPAQPRRQRRRPELLARRGGVQELADVAQVGQPALAVGAREHAAGQALGRA